MKLAIDSVVPFLLFGNEKMVEMIRNAGFDAMDYSFYDVPENRSVLGENYREQALRLREVLDHFGLECNQAHAPHNMTDGEPLDLSSKKYREIVRSMEFAAILGAKNIIVHCIKRPAEGSDLFRSNYRFYKSLEPFCKEYKIRVAVENLWVRDSKRSCFKGIFGTPGELTRMVELLDSEWFTACLDLGHAALTGLEPEEFISGMSKNVLGCLHVHDTDYLSDTHTIPFHGGHNWNGICQALAQIGYEGDFNLEVLRYLGNYPPELLPEALAHAEKVGRYLIDQIEKAKQPIAP